MSTADAYRNLLWRMESITPTDTDPARGFLFYSPRDFNPETARGTVRSFTLFWDGSDPDDEPTDITERVADHQFTVEVAYSTDYPLDKLNELVLSDRNDILKTLRDTDGFVGVSDAQPTKATGIWSRVRTRDELDRGNSNIWYLRIVWRCKIQEAE